MSLGWYLDAIVVGIALPWVIVTYRLIGAFKRGVGAGLAQWALWAAACVPAMLLVMWGIHQMR